MITAKPTCTIVIKEGWQFDLTTFCLRLPRSPARDHGLGDVTRWTQVLNDHDTLVSRELERHRGPLVKHTGDGVLATFDGRGRAVRCAQSIVESVRHIGLEIRAGVHSGEIELRGDDVGGIAVHIGQRVSALAGPGEVLVSRTVTDLVAGSGLGFLERGKYGLTGVPGLWQLFAVTVYTASPNAG